MRFLTIARGSLSELETQIIIGYELGYMKNNKNLLMKTDKVFGLLGGLMKYTKRKIKIQS